MSGNRLNNIIVNRIGKSNNILFFISELNRYIAIGKLIINPIIVCSKYFIRITILVIFLNPIVLKVCMRKALAKKIIKTELSILHYALLATSNILIGVGFGLMLSTFFLPFSYPLIVLGAIFLIPTLYHLMKEEVKDEKALEKELHPKKKKVVKKKTSKSKTTKKK